MMPDHGLLLASLSLGPALFAAAPFGFVQETLISLSSQFEHLSAFSNHTHRMARPLVRRFHFHQAGADLNPYIFMSPKGSSAAV